MVDRVGGVTVRDASSGVVGSLRNLNKIYLKGVGNGRSCS